MSVTSAQLDYDEEVRMPNIIAYKLKVNNFDGLRLIFALMVVFFHISLLSNIQSIAFVHRSISSLFAVQAFFVVSGFLVTMSFEKSSSLAVYIRKRIFRIYPAYACCVVMAAVSLVLLSSLPPSEYFTHREFWRYVGLNLALSNFAQPSLPGVFAGQFETAVNGSLWTIKLEFMYYFLVPIIVWAARRFGYLHILMGLFLGSIIWHVGFQYLGEATGSEFYVRLAKQLPGQLGFFAGGAWAYYRTREGLSPAPFWMALIGTVLYATTAGLPNVLVAPACVTVIVYFAAIALPRLWSAERTGDFSYGVYLYHFPIAQAAIALGLFTAAPITGFVLVTATAVVVAILSWHLLEKRALVWGHRGMFRPVLK